MSFALSGTDTRHIWLALTLFGNIYRVEPEHRLLTGNFAPRLPGTHIAPAPTSAQIGRIVNALALFHGFLSRPGFPDHDDDGRDITDQTQEEVRALVVRLVKHEGLNVAAVDEALAQAKRTAESIELVVPT